MVRKTLVGAAAVIAVVTGISCGGDSDTVVPASGARGSNTVVLKDIAFKPATITVETGDTVTWVFDDRGIPHNVVADDKSFESETQDSGTFEHTFEDPGSVPYTCTIHPDTMKGTVRVR